MSKENPLGLTKKDYMGSKSTLCTGCGHDSITNNIITAFFQSGVPPYKVAKMSGIGCSSKTPAYFINQAHGFNSLHGRMAPVSIGAKLANPELVMIGVSGDGDTASIGLGGFCHLVRRNLPIVYIIENNGVYGLTKGQFSATAEKDMTLKSGTKNPFMSIDLCTLALDLGCGFVARSFSGDSKQLVPIIDAALRYEGTSVIDVISPCVTFANHEGSTKSYTYVKEHKVALHELGFIQPQEEITVDYQEGDSTDIQLHDGSRLILKKLDSKLHDLKDSRTAMRILQEHRDKGEVLTGLFHFDEEQESLVKTLELTETPSSQMNETQLRPSRESLAGVLAQFH